MLTRIVLALSLVAALAGFSHAQSGTPSGAPLTAKSDKVQWDMANGWYTTNVTGNAFWVNPLIPPISDEYRFKGTFTTTTQYSDYRLSFSVQYATWFYNDFIALPNAPPSGTWTTPQVMFATQDKPIGFAIVLQAWVGGEWVSVSGPEMYDIYYANFPGW